MDTIEIATPGLLTSVQDLGRYGHQRYGVPVAGALDTLALRAANLVCGNCQGAAGLEIFLHGLEVRFLTGTTIAVTGGNLTPRLNGRDLPMWRAIEVERGDCLTFRDTVAGCRAYMALSGGLDVPLVMESRSTYLKGGFGGFRGRQLQAGDRLKTLPRQAMPSKKPWPPDLIPACCEPLHLRAIPGPQDDCFTREGFTLFFGSTYTISPQADRMGYRLEGAPIQHKSGADIISDGNPAGAVQIPGDGLPIILLADCHTTGGYPKIATLASVDIDRLAQALPGDKVRFMKTPLVEAGRLLEERELAIKKIEKELHGRVQ